MTKMKELEKALAQADIEEQREILIKFAMAATGDEVLEGIRIANQSLMSTSDNFVISSHIKE
jgi:type VI protein secretion system component VasF